MSGGQRLADPAAAAERLASRLAAGEVVPLPAPGEEEPLAAALAVDAPAGPAVVLGSGGSSGGRRWMQLDLAALEVAADGVGHWLAGQAIDPAACLCLNPLALHHVSGLMPWLRARRWGADLRWLAPALLRDPAALVEACPLPADRPVLLSLVPTQLARLLSQPEGAAWLAGCRLIWLGGAALPPDLAAEARRLGLPLAPCYGCTETGAMVAALAPERFLAGEAGCGPALPHAALRLDPTSGAVQVRSASLAVGEHGAGRFRPLPLAAGWWSSGDRGRLGPAGGLELLGRLDGAISSGGETVFPEQVEQALAAAARAAGLPLRHLLLLAEPDPLWGERLVALVRAEAEGDGAAAALIPALTALAAALPPSQRPRRWLACADLAPTALGKWQRAAWGRVLAGR
ncbi:MAG: AMP-binding protein [Cyanobacteriota bacterium]|nr:AMP-binding protein [Cyanobacteriota bacterium]